MEVLNKVNVVLAAVNLCFCLYKAIFSEEKYPWIVASLGWFVAMINIWVIIQL